MRNYLLLVVSLLALNLLGGIAGCSGCDDPGEVGYFLEISIAGLPEAFENRKIEIAGNPVEELRARMGFKGQLVTVNSYCSDSKDRFLNEPLWIVVYEDDEVVSETLLERIACKYSENADSVKYGWDERVTVFLNLDGTIDARFGDSENTFATCWEPGYSTVCMNSVRF